MFISLFGEREREQERAWGREKETENPKQAPHCQCRALGRAQSHEA